MGAWMTIQSCELDLQDSDMTYEFILVSNGGKETDDTHLHVLSLKEAGHLAHYSHRDEPMSPPDARQYGVQFATGKYLAFFDNHCLLVPGYFKRAKLDFERYNMDSLHSATHYDYHRKPIYHYQRLFKRGFWGEESSIPERGGLLPYRIAMGGHGGFLVKADTFREVGGYWDGFRGYAGEEPYFDLKLAMLDKTNWLDPKLAHIHYVGTRGYVRHYSEDYFRNFLMVSNIIGGEKWTYRTYEHLFKQTKMRFGNSKLYEILMDAEESSAEHAAWFRSVQKRTLDEQIRLFDAECIAH